MMFVFFKQKTAYEMRISDWSSDVCSSDLRGTIIKPAAETATPLMKRRREKSPREESPIEKSSFFIFKAIIFQRYPSSPGDTSMYSKMSLFVWKNLTRPAN